MDPVGKPKHYFAGGFECGEIVDALRERWQASGLDAHRLASAFEYLFRCGSKDNARQDAEKAINYLHRALYGTWFPFELRRQREASAAEERPYSEARARREDATQGNGEKAQDRSADRYGVTTTAEHDTPSPASSAPAPDALRSALEKALPCYDDHEGPPVCRPTHSHDCPAHLRGKVYAAVAPLLAAEPTVTCEACAFRYGAEHTDADGEYRCPLCELAAERERADELEQLFDLQRTRMVAAIERWRAEAPTERALTLPDLGRLLEWLMAQADAERAAREAAEREVEKLRHALSKHLDSARHDVMQRELTVEIIGRLAYDEGDAWAIEQLRNVIAGDPSEGVRTAASDFIDEDAARSAGKEGA